MVLYSYIRAPSGLQSHATTDLGQWCAELISISIYGKPAVNEAGNRQPASGVRARRGLANCNPDPYPSVPYP